MRLSNDAKAQDSLLFTSNLKGAARRSNARSHKRDDDNRRAPHHTFHAHVGDEKHLHVADNSPATWDLLHVRKVGQVLVVFITPAGRGRQGGVLRARERTRGRARARSHETCRDPFSSYPGRSVQRQCSPRHAPSITVYSATKLVR